MKLSVIMPVYNEEHTLHIIVEKVFTSLQNLKQELGYISDFELIIVDDGSQDQTPLVVKKLLNQYIQEINEHALCVFFQPHNQGKGAALIKGFELATGDLILIQDADLEYTPDDYPALIRPFIFNNADVVYGSRFKGEVRKILFFWHALGNYFLTFLSNAFTNLNFSDMETCYKVFRAPVIKEMILTSHRFGIEPEMTAKIAKVKGLVIFETPISYFGRTYSEGKKIGWKDGFSAIWCILKFNLLNNFEDSFRCSEEWMHTLLKKNRSKERPMQNSLHQELMNPSTNPSR